MRKSILASMLTIAMPGVLIGFSFLPVFAQQTLPDTAVINGFYGYAQTYTLSCESRAASDWANYFGYPVSEGDLLRTIPTSDNPEKGFVGYFDGWWGSIPPYDYGVHPPPVVDALNSYGVPAVEGINLSWDDLRYEIANNRPVLIWIIGQMENGYAQEYADSVGDVSIVAKREHVMNLIGYTPISVVVFDSLTGSVKYFPIDAFLTSWSVLGNRAIIAAPVTPTATPTPENTPTPTITPTPPDHVVVVEGDTLLGIAARHNITWQQLTSLNNLVYPYFIYPGDVLKLPPWED